MNDKGKYVAIYAPSCSKAWKNGWAYEHIVVAEQMIGRPLLPEEVIHHKDENKSNNNPDNLMIFSTKADHTGFHKGSELIDNGDGTYSSKRSERKESKTGKTLNPIILCPVCKINMMTKGSNMCLECYTKEQSKSIPSKEQLLEELANNLCNKSAIGRLYSVSSKTVDRWCDKYNIIKAITFDK